jgi:hypothetical protein
MNKKGENRSWLKSTTQVLVRKQDVATCRDLITFWDEQAEKHRTTAEMCAARANGMRDTLKTLGL